MKDFLTKEDDWETRWGDFIAHFKNAGERKNTTLNNMRRVPNSQMEKEIKAFIKVELTSQLEELDRDVDELPTFNFKGNPKNGGLCVDLSSVKEKITRMIDELK